MTLALNRKYLLLIGLVVGWQISLAEQPPDRPDKPQWATSYTRELAPDEKDRRFYLFHVSQGSEHLLGAFALARHTKRPIPLIVQGHLNDLGEFAPNITLAVSDQEDGNWKTIDSSFSDKVDVTLTGAGHVDKLFFRIQLDALQPYTEKFKFCRVSLQTGESDVIPMVWLTPKGGD
jgi:hypothetical protein